MVEQIKNSWNKNKINRRLNKGKSALEPNIAKVLNTIFCVCMFWGGGGGIDNTICSNFLTANILEGQNLNNLNNIVTSKLLPN